jgi:gingipain R
MRKVITLACFLLAGNAFAQEGKSTVVVYSTSPAEFSLRVVTGPVALAEAGSGYQSVQLNRAARTLDAGAPDVPTLSYGVFTGATPGAVTVESSRYHDVYDVRLAPSKGNLSRTVNPADVAFTEGRQYSEDKFYPETLTAWGDAYTVRNATGHALRVHPVQYNPVRRILRVYDEINLAVATPAARKPIAAEIPEWQEMLSRRFINWGFAPAAAQQKTTYTPLPESGAMLIVTPARFLSTLQPFLAWKKMRGIRTYVVNTDTLAGGATAANIKALVQGRYNTQTLDYLLLVGDEADIPPVIDFVAYSGPSDVAYAYLTGADHYPDLLVGRFSATTTAQLQTQITRSIEYEKNPVLTAAWYPKAIGIASNEGPGDDNQMDWEHMRGVRTALMGAGYTAVGEYYDGSHGGADAPGDPVEADIVSAINGGTTLLNYCGHGWDQGFGTSGFSNMQVPQLTNSAGQWPFVYTVACVTGEFFPGTCLGEALMRATTTGGVPTGSIGVFSSSINQSWDPPMEAQDELTDLIITPDSMRMHSMGALAASSTMAMNDAYGYAGDEMTDTWILFGDPSLALRTRKPDTLKVTHAATMLPAAGNLPISVTNPAATVTILHRDTLLSVKRPVSGATTHLRPALLVGDSVIVSVTAPNARPYRKAVKVVAQTSVEEPVEVASVWQVSPNPTTDFLNVQGTEIGTYSLADVTGRVVQSGALSAGKTPIPLREFTAGTYLLSLRGASGAQQVMKVQVIR